MLRVRSIATLAAMAFFGIASSPARAELAFAVDSNIVLVSFDTERPDRLFTSAVIRGLQPGENILGIDFRPQNRKLYGLGSSGRIYVIDTASALATAVGSSAFSTPLDGTSFGFDFNPTVDRIRITSNKGQNLRAHPETGALVATDGALNYTDGMAPGVVASAYTNSFFGANSTVLYNIDAARRQLVTQSPPNAGALNVVGPITGIDLTNVAGFDISPNTNLGYFIVRSGRGRETELYQIDLRSGATQFLGEMFFFEQLGSLAIAPLDEKGQFNP